MKQIVLAILSFLAGAQVPAAPTSPQLCTLRIQATGFRNQKGLAEAAVFSSPDGWPERENKSIASDGIPISGHEATLSFQVPQGEYAVVVLHDENLNHKLDRGFLGIPKEGFGFANNPRVFLSAPPFKAATVNVACPITNIEVKMIYK